MRTHETSRLNRRSTGRATVVLLLAACLGAGAASAQPSSPPSSTPAPPGPTPPASPTPPEVIAPQGSPLAGGAKSGVIKPPTGVDPGIQSIPPVTSPAPNSMPVIPPPGTPGGNPSVQPK
jgi:hypothetical protein